MELGDRYLVVQRAQIGQNAKKEKENNPDAQRNNFNQFNNFAGGQATAAATSVLAAVKSGEGEKTRVLQMLNMVNQEELVDDQEYGEILEDIRDECGASQDLFTCPSPQQPTDSFSFSRILDR
jgi:splicing factor U2AF subunit